MRRELIAFLFVVILLSVSLIAAETAPDATTGGTDTANAQAAGAGNEDTTGTQTSEAGDGSTTGTQAAGDGSVAGQLGELKEGVDTTKVQSKTNEVLAKEIEIPENLQVIARVVFGFKTDEPVDLQTFIVLICLWIAMLILIAHFLVIGVGRGAKSWLLAIVVNLVLSSLGITLQIAGFFSDLGSFFGYLRSWSILSLILAIMVLFIVVYLLQFLAKYIESRMNIEGARSVGRGIAFASTLGQTTSDMTKP
ncbi:hypothetical protein J4233_03180 [Candidatus Pacearchaeota archaeon]|nr:hypothetical protein [Candidatus Pacearchaeota archaeon]